MFLQLQRYTGLSMLLLLVIISCTDDNTNSRTDELLFKSVDEESSNIYFANNLVESDSLNYFTYSYLYMGGGVSAGDINNDGLIDLYFTGNMVPNKLYLNKGNFQFEDISEAAGVAGDNRWYTGVTMTDINNDGFLDIYCSVGGKFGPKENVLYINNGDLSFTDKARDYGIDDQGNSVQGTFFDYDLDGDLDLYVANYPPTSFNAPNSYYQYKQANVTDIETDNLYRNDGDRFVRATEEAGLKNFGLSLSATVGDINQDGWPDLYVSNDFSTPDQFYINNKNGTFTERSRTLLKNTSFYGMGVDIADFNNDLLLDIFQVDMTAQDNRRSKANMAGMDPTLFWSTVNSGFHYQYMQNSLQMNNGTINDSLPDFSNVARLAGISSTDWSWGPIMVDLDNDGWKDIFIANGTRREINNKDYFDKWEKSSNKSDSLLQRSLNIPTEKIDNFVYRNNRNLGFDEVGHDWGLNYKGWSNGSIYADLDNDGDMDIVTSNIDDYASVFENHASSKNNHIKLRFKGNAKNVFGVGVKVTVETSTTTQFQELTLTRGFQSSVAPEMQFGLGQSDIIDTIRVEWPDGREILLDNVAVNQLLILDYEDTKLTDPKTNVVTDLLFATERDTNIAVTHRHIENYYDDFASEILLPHKTSVFGPGISVGDLNGDQLEDFVIGGALSSETGVYFQSPEGFIKQDITAIKADSRFEDIGSLIFDADGDGDQDLYVVSGGNEFASSPTMLQDRLYINDGTGQFVKEKDALPEMLTSGASVHSYDYDKDGDLDLFVGGRLVPGNYPAPASSHLLKNVSDNGDAKFVDVTHEIAPGLNDIGLVTSASWTDYDGDGAVDLVVTGEWMPITVFKNLDGTFTNVTEKVGLENSTGWWFSLKEGDFDADGDMDFIVGNLGLNYKYKASENETFDIYLNDFDKNQREDIVLSYFNGGEKYPVRGRECSSQQIPVIKVKYKNYESFASASLVDVYTKEDLDKSLHYQAKTFASVYLENQGGKFQSHQLPQLAQLSSVNQIIVKDFDNDTYLDAAIVGNMHGSEVETPRNDASNGLFLKGDGQGNFEAVEGRRSGLYAPGDVKDMKEISIRGNDYLIIAKNNDYVQLVRIEN